MRFDVVFFLLGHSHSKEKKWSLMWFWQLIGFTVDFFFRQTHPHHGYSVVIHSMDLHSDRLSLITMINWSVNRWIFSRLDFKSINYLGFRIPSSDHRENKSRTNRIILIDTFEYIRSFRIALTTLPTFARHQQATLIYTNENSIKVHLNAPFSSCSIEIYVSSG